MHHPQGFGLGNAGQTASRTNHETPVKAGESNYTELGVELGLLGSLLWLAWGLTLLVGLARTGRDERWAAGLAAAFAAVLAAGDPDRRDRRPLDRVLHVGARRRARHADTSARASCGRGHRPLALS